MNWMTYYLSKNPSIKSRVIDGLREMFLHNATGRQPLPSPQLSKLRLLDHVERSVFVSILRSDIRRLGILHLKVL